MYDARTHNEWAFVDNAITYICSLINDIVNTPVNTIANGKQLEENGFIFMAL